jgi:hypothetical protein
MSLAFAYFEGVFRVLRYDNLSSAVKKILRGQQRELTARFIASRSHWQYQTECCTPGEGHERRSKLAACPPMSAPSQTIVAAVRIWPHRKVEGKVSLLRDDRPRSGQ